MYSVLKKLKKSYQKNVPEFLALKKKMYPEFIYEGNPKTLKDEIAVFTLHSVLPHKFEMQLEFLYNNGYRTLAADELYECLIGEKQIPERAVVLTFDDGWKNVYTEAYPLLKKYNMSAVCFIIPGIIDNKQISNNEKINLNERGPNSDTLCSWSEIKEMHESGIIDFQSHSMYHNRIFVSNVIDDFFYPAYDSYACNLNIPIYSVNNSDNVSRETKLGTPIYRYSSKFSGKQRYFDDQNIRDKCIEYVKLNGGEEFFTDNNWRKKLFSHVEEYRMKYNDSGHFQDEENYRESLFNDFSESKILIENELPDKTVNHFCYPWWEGSETALSVSKEAGYLTNFWGVFPDRRTNRCGEDPYKISRILTDDYIFRLPGQGRKSLLTIYEERFFGNSNRFIKVLLQSDKK